MRKVLGLVAVSYILCATTGAVFAEDSTCASSISTSVDLAYVSKYVWRGTVPNPDPAFQPSITLANDKGLSFNFWASMDTTGIYDNSGTFTEHDYTLSYAFSQGCCSMTTGYVYYAFPNTTFHSTQELFGSVCFGGLLSPTLSINYDVDEADGFYAALSGGYSCNLMAWKKTPTTLNLSAKLGYGSSDYNSFYFFGQDKSALDDLVLTASVPFEMNGKYKITPSVSYSMAVDGSIRDALAANGVDKDNFVAGLTFSTAF
ncbi:MAG: hypothetical protein ABFD54_17145 [Armatimonadota bacterium]